MAQYTIGIDIGGTNIKSGLLDAQQRILSARTIETLSEAGFEACLVRILALIDELISAAGLSKPQIGCIGVGVPGPLSHARGVVLNAPNLKGWVNIPLRDRLQEGAGLRCVIENDANCAAFGEFRMGAGVGTRDMVMLTLGTGIGGGIVLGGQLVRGHFDSAGEIGHTIVDPDGRACPCGQRGCLERYASANAVAERFAEAVLADPKADSPLAQAVRRGVAVDSADVLAARNGGDALAARIWGEMTQFLGIACVNLQHILNPELIVLGGGLVNAGADLLEPVRQQFGRFQWRMCPDFPRIELATRGEQAAVFGAAALARVTMATIR